MELNSEAYQAKLGILPSFWKENRGSYIRLHLDYPFGRKWWSHQRQRMLAKPSLGPVVTVTECSHHLELIETDVPGVFPLYRDLRVFSETQFSARSDRGAREAEAKFSAGGRLSVWKIGVPPDSY